MEVSLGIVLDFRFEITISKRCYRLHLRSELVSSHPPNHNLQVIDHGNLACLGETAQHASHTWQTSRAVTIVSIAHILREHPPLLSSLQNMTDDFNSLAPHRLVAER